MKTRSGYALVELLVVIAVGSAVMGVAVAMLHMLMKLESDARDQLRNRTTMSRLAEHFREDVHAALRLSPDAASSGKSDSPAVCRLDLPDGRSVRYHALEGELVRVVLVGGKPVGQESFRVPEDAAVSVDRSDESGGKLLSLRIDTPGDPPEGYRFRPVLIDAVLSHDYRFRELKEP